MAPRRAILVVGMHRSGTSALARVVNLLGATLPAQLYPPEPENPTGYWESAHIAGLNEWILQSANATWSDCIGFAPERIAGDALVGVMASLVDAVKQEFGDAALFVLKDPRLCLLLDFWLPALANLGIEATLLLTLRHPVEVAHSLLRRNRLPPFTAIALWLRYVLTAEFRSRGLPRSIVPYDALLTDWRCVIDQAAFDTNLIWPNDPGDVDADMQSFLTHDLRHHSATSTAIDIVPAPLRAWTEDAYAALRDLASHALPEPPMRILDRVRTEFAAWCQAGRTPNPTI